MQNKARQLAQTANLNQGKRLTEIKSRKNKSFTFYNRHLRAKVLFIESTCRPPGGAARAGLVLNSHYNYKNKMAEVSAKLRSENVDLIGDRSAE